VITLVGLNQGACKCQSSLFWLGHMTCMHANTEDVPRRSGSLLRAFSLAGCATLICVFLVEYAVPLLMRHYSVTTPAWYLRKVEFVFANLAPVIASLPILYPSRLLRGIKREMRTAALVLICFALTLVQRMRDWRCSLQFGSQWSRTADHRRRA
jgi:hypothetical protein